MLRATPRLRYWDNACPAGISYAEHIRSLATVMVEEFWSTGMTGVFKAHPLVASLLVVSDPVQFGNLRFDAVPEWPMMVGYIGGIQFWADPDVGGNEVLVVDDKDSLQHRTMMKLQNFYANIPAL